MPILYDFTSEPILKNIHAIGGNVDHDARVFWHRIRPCGDGLVFIAVKMFPALAQYSRASSNSASAFCSPMTLQLIPLRVVAIVPQCPRFFSGRFAQLRYSSAATFFS